MPTCSPCTPEKIWKVQILCLVPILMFELYHVYTDFINTLHSFKIFELELYTGMDKIFFRVFLES